MADDQTLNYKGVLVSNTETDLTGGGVSVGDAGTAYLNLNNDTESDIVVARISRGTGASPAPADLIRTEFTIEPKGWALFRRIKMGEGMKLWITADGPLTVDFSGRKEG